MGLQKVKHDWATELNWTELICGVGKDSWESLGLQSDQACQSQKTFSPEYSLQGLILKLKLQYFHHLMGRTDSSEKNPDAGEDWQQEEKGTAKDEMFG